LARIIRQNLNRLQKDEASPENSTDPRLLAWL